MSRTHSPLDILIDRACGVPDEPDATALDAATRFAQSVAIETCDFLLSFLGATRNPKAAMAKQAAVDFIAFDIRRRMERSGKEV